MATDFSIYDAALAAEKAFWQACIKQFGIARASHGRYQPALFDQDTKQAHDSMISAALDWQIEAMRARGRPQGD